MITIMVPMLVISALGGFCFLMGSSAWYKKDMPRAILYSTVGFFMIMSMTFFVVLNSVDYLIDEKLKQAGLPTTQAYSIPPYEQ